MITSMVKKGVYQPLINRFHDVGILKIFRIDIKIITSNCCVGRPNLPYIDTIKDPEATVRILASTKQYTSQTFKYMDYLEKRVYKNIGDKTLYLLT